MTASQQLVITIRTNEWQILGDGRTDDLLPLFGPGGHPGMKFKIIGDYVGYQRSSVWLLGAALLGPRFLVALYPAGAWPPYPIIPDATLNECKKTAVYTHC